MHEGVNGEEVDFSRMLLNFGRLGQVKHYLSTEEPKLHELLRAIAAVVSVPKTFNRVPQIVLRWLVDSGASQHVLPSDFVNNNSEHCINIFYLYQLGPVLLYTVGL